MSNVIQFPGVPERSAQPAFTFPKPENVAVELEQLHAELVRIEAATDQLHVVFQKLNTALKQAQQ